MTNPILIHSGFDGLDLAFRARTPLGLQACLETAKERAAAAQKPVLADYRGRELLVGPSGKPGGYSYSIDTGPLGAIFFFKRNNQRDPWGVFASSRSLPLATKGLLRVKSEMDDFLSALGVEFDPDQTRVSRADFAVDHIVEGFELDPDLIVSHSRMTHAEVGTVEMYGISQKRSSIRIGKMPSCQVGIYDKRKDVLDKGKNAWWTIWNNNAQARHGAAASVDQSQAIWRCEIRLGSGYLGKKLTHRTWPRFLAEVRPLFLEAATRIRYAKSSSRLNRSYWPNSPLWAAVILAIQEMEFFGPPTDISPKILAQLEIEHRGRLESQLGGFLRALAAANQIPLADIPTFSRYAFHRIISEFNSGNPDMAAAYAEKCREWNSLYGGNRRKP